MKKTIIPLRNSNIFCSNLAGWLESLSYSHRKKLFDLYEKASFKVLKEGNCQVRTNWFLMRICVLSLEQSTVDWILKNI